MPSPSRPKGKGTGGSERQPRGSGQRGKRLRATASAPAPELFPEEETAGFAARPRSAPQEPAGVREKDPSGVSKQALKFVLGVLLLPVAFILTGGFLGALKHADLTDGFDKRTIHALQAKIHQSGLKNVLSEHPKGLHLNSLQCLVVGMLIFLVLQAVAPRKILMLAYVFGHEVTHALWVKLFGGKVADQFHVSLEGGHVLTDRVNTWIVLSPYFFPIFSILSGTLYGALLLSGKIIDLINGREDLYPSTASFQWLFLVVLGCTLAFHLAFTFLLVTKSQPDLHYGGTFFSLTVIYLINLLIITGLIFLTNEYANARSFYDYLRFYWESVGNSADLLIFLCGQIWAWGAEGIDALRTAIGK
jgi:hypothetical protein